MGWPKGTLGFGSLLKEYKYSYESLEKRRQICILRSLREHAKGKLHGTKPSKVSFKTLYSALSP